MHRTLKMDAAGPTGSNFLQQQSKFDAFVKVFNNERPHEALDMKCPGEVYKGFHAAISGHRRTILSFSGSDSFGYLLRKDLHLQKENKSKHFSRRSSSRHHIRPRGFLT